ncbi:DUF5713 family protein [Streptomyces sp. NPDC127112]|uniref:DUF5713 family protein n=1 Tax=Streptomyces sp. NPDC127112 TaxID=3345364 RepID=UPI00362BF333
MYDDPYFPDHLVNQGKTILVRLCERVEADWPPDLQGLYALTQAATEEFNLLDRDFVAVGSGIETAAREWICDEFCFVAPVYGFIEADAEELTAGRDW